MNFPQHFEKGCSRHNCDARRWKDPPCFICCISPSLPGVTPDQRSLPKRNYVIIKLQIMLYQKRWNFRQHQEKPFCFGNFLNSLYPTRKCYHVCSADLLGSRKDQIYCSRFKPLETKVTSSWGRQYAVS